MSNAPYNTTHLKYRYQASVAAADRPLRPGIDAGLFHQDELGATLSVINEVANQLGIDAPEWCHFMEDALHRELRGLRNREDILCGLHERVAAQMFRQNEGPDLHRGEADDDAPQPRSGAPKQASPMR